MTNEIIIDRAVTFDARLEFFGFNEFSMLLKSSKQLVIAVDDHMVDSLEIMLLRLQFVHHSTKIFNLLLLLFNGDSLRIMLSFISENFL